MDRLTWTVSEGHPSRWVVNNLHKHTGWSARGGQKGQGHEDARNPVSLVETVGSFHRPRQLTGTFAWEEMEESIPQDIKRE